MSRKTEVYKTQTGHSFEYVTTIVKGFSLILSLNLDTTSFESVPAHETINKPKIQIKSLIYNCLALA